MNQVYVIIFFMLSVTASCVAQELFIDTICYNQNVFDCGLMYQIKSEYGGNDTMFVSGVHNSTDVKFQFTDSDTLAILRGSLVTGRAELMCYWYVRNENNSRSKYGWKWQLWNHELLFQFRPTGTPWDSEGNYIPQKKGRVPVSLDNLVIVGFGNIYEIIDGEKLWYGNKYFEEISNGSQPVYQLRALSLLAKHIGKENLDPKVAKWYFKE